MFARPIHLCCLVLHRASVQATVGTSDFCQASLSSSYSEICGTECVQSASGSGWEMVLVVLSGAGPQMTHLG